MTVKKVVRKVVDKVKSIVTPKVVVVKTEVQKTVCSNCNDSGRHCSVCTPVFHDTFGK